MQDTIKYVHMVSMCKYKILNKGRGFLGDGHNGENEIKGMNRFTELCGDRKDGQVIGDGIGGMDR